MKTIGGKSSKRTTLKTERRRSVGQISRTIHFEAFRLSDLDQNSFFKTIAVIMEQMNNVTNLELISRLILNVNHIEAHRYMLWHASTWSIG